MSIPVSSKVPPIIGPIAATVAASFSLVTAFYAALGSTSLGCATVIFIAVPAMILSATYAWISYILKYIDFRIEEKLFKTKSVV